MLWAVSFCLASMTAHDAPEKVILVCPPAWRQAMAPWIRLREEHGYRVVLLPNANTPQQVHQQLQQELKSGAAKCVLLIGDVEVTPTWTQSAQVNVRWGSEPLLATDQPYGDSDGDGFPEIAVGRLSVDTPEQLAVIVAKILRHENDLNFGSWRRKVHVVAGVGGFGPLVDPVLQMATSHLLTKGLPSDYQLSVTQGDWQSPYCPDPRHFRNVVIERLNEGGLFWVYIGHGQRTYLDVMRTPMGAFPILDANDRQRIECPQGQPVALFLACYAGAMDFHRESLAEQLQRQEGGPIAVLAGSRVTMPYGMAVMAHHMMEECFQNRRATLGDIVLHAKRHMWSGQQTLRQPSDHLREARSPALVAEGSTPDSPDAASSSHAAADEDRRMLDAIAQAISPEREQLDAELREHVLMFNLFGDPLLTMRYPDSVDVQAPEEIRGGQFVDVRCKSPVAGALQVELICRRDRSTRPLIRRSQFRAETLGDFDITYRQANQRVWDQRQTERVTAGDAVRVRLQAPKDAAGPGHVRVYVEGSSGFAMGSSDIYIRPSSSPAPPAPPARSASE